MVTNSEKPKIAAPPRFYHPTNPALTPNDFTKSIYLNLLDTFPDEDIIAFWDALPLHISGRKLSTHELLSYLWQENVKVSVVWDYSVARALEPFLVAHNVTVLEFFRKLLYRNNNSTYIPGRFLLKWFYPVMKRVFQVDPRSMMLQLIPFFSGNLFPHSLCRRVKHAEVDGWIESVMLHITDDSFSETIHYDVEIEFGEQAKASPGVLGWPPFEEVNLLAETRPLSLVVWKGAVDEKDGIATLDGEAIGHRIDFNDFCRAKEIDLSAINFPAGTCILMDMDYFCPFRKRIVLHKGCVYNAPVNLVTVRHKRLNNYSQAVLSTMVYDLEGDQPPLAKRLQNRHNELLAKIQENLIFKYFDEDESITLNGEHFVKGVSAKILRSLLTVYLKEGRCEFEYREFKRNFEISLGQKKSNFEVRFFRLMEKLEEKCPSIKILKSGRGRFTLSVKAKVSLAE